MEEARLQEFPQMYREAEQAARSVEAHGNSNGNEESDDGTSSEIGLEMLYDDDLGVEIPDDQVKFVHPPLQSEHH